jgi:membrane protease YdiL (CAAX protease family)
VSLRFLAGFAAIWGALELTGTGQLSAPRGLVALVVTALVAAWVEHALLGTPPGGLIRRLGLGRPSAPAMLLAFGVAAACLGVYPLFTLVTGEVAELRAGWPWLLAGLFAFNGLAEELAWRAYTFGHLRETRSFSRAALATMPLLAATHVPIAVSSGPAIGLGAMLAAAVTTVPLARLYELGRRTIWAPAVVHTAIDGFRLVTVPHDAQPALSMLIIAVSLIVPLVLVELFSRRRRPGTSASPVARLGL